MQLIRIPMLGGSLLLSALLCGPAAANSANSLAQGTAAGADEVPHQETVCYWVGAAQGQSYECGLINWGTEWDYRDSNFADTDNVTGLQPTASAQGNTAQAGGGSSAAFAETALGINKARIETHSAPRGGATANATSTWEAGLLMATPNTSVQVGHIVFRIQGSAAYTGDSEFSWRFDVHYDNGLDPDSGGYYFSEATVAGGTAAGPVPMPGRPPIGGGNYTYLGTQQDVDYELILPIQFQDSGVFSAKLDLSGKSWSDRLTRIEDGGDFFDLDNDQQADDWLPRLVASVEEEKAQGEVLLDFSHTVTVTGLYVPQGVTVSLVGGGDAPFPVFHTAAVPEPQTWAMLLAGLGLVGLFARRRMR